MNTPQQIEKFYDFCNMNDPLFMAEFATFLDTEFDVNEALNEKGERALSYCIKYGKYELVKVCVEKNANLNVKNDEGLEPILQLCEADYGSFSRLQFFLERGANPNVAN